MPDWARVAIVGVGFAFALGSEWVRLDSGWPASWVLTDLLPGIAFLVCGLVAWRRRPDNRIGPLMVATGFAWYVGTYTATTDPVAARLAHAFQGWFDAFLAWLVLAFPTGRLRSTPARAVIALFFGWLAVRAAVRIPAFHLSTEYDLGNPAEIDRFVADQTFRDAADTVFRLGVAVLAVAVLVLVVLRLRNETDLGRRVAGPILFGGIAFALGIVIETWVVAAAVNGFGERSFAWEIGRALTISTVSLVPMAFLWGLARSRLRRATVADLVVELGAQGTPQLRDVLARALQDPSLEIAYPAAGGPGFVDGAGAAVSMPRSNDPARAITRLDVGGRTVAVLVHDSALAERPELVRPVAAAAALAIENDQLAADVRAQLEEVRRSRARIVAAGDAERRRIERDIHDGAQQRLVTLALTLQLARTHAEATDPDLAETLAAASAELEKALAELRQLARGLHPAVLIEEGLGPAVEALADRTPFPVRVRVTGERFAPDVEATAYFVVAEALTNAVKHAGAASAEVAIERADGVLVVTVSDDGVGGAVASPGSGLAGLDDRVAAAGGTLAVRSSAESGTTIKAEIPCG